MSSTTTASQEELKAHRVPLAWRDQCSAYVIAAYSYAESPNPLFAGHNHIIPRLPFSIESLTALMDTMRIAYCFR